MGLRFDIVISGYIIILPFFIIFISSIFKSKSKIVIYITLSYLLFFFSLAFLVCAVDIPYFNQFFSRFSITAFEWIDSPIFVSKMIIEEPRYWLYIIPYLLIVFFFYLSIKKIFLYQIQEQNTNIVSNIILSIISILLIILGIRGRLDEKSPIKIGTAYFGNNAFLNQLGLNPNFTLIRSYLDSKDVSNQRINLLNDSIAIANMQQYLNIIKYDSINPLARHILNDSLNHKKYNVILVIMESMSASKLGRNGNTNNLSPFLDSISKKSYYFDNAYTAGIHTFNGIFSSIFAYPALFRQHPMKESAMYKYHNSFSTLKSNGYSTIYFTTHDGQFDNVEGFLRANDCQTIITKSNYPSDKIKTTLGVPDDYMFEYSIPILNRLYKSKKPFYSVFMTASDHGPYYIPEYFKPKNKDIKNQIVEYADYSLNKFIELSAKQEWFKNTIFVFVADHGAPMDNVYNMSLSYNHTPLIFYAPHIIKDYREIHNMAGQIDIYPTIMGLLGINYDNYTLGIDLLREKRPYIFFNADDKYGVIDQEWFLIVNYDKSLGLYKYRNNDTHDYSKEMPDLVNKMNTYAKSNLQAYQYILSNNKQ